MGLETVLGPAGVDSQVPETHVPVFVAGEQGVAVETVHGQDGTVTGVDALLGLLERHVVDHQLVVHDCGHESLGLAPLHLGDGLVRETVARQGFQLAQRVALLYLLRRLNLPWYHHLGHVVGVQFEEGHHALVVAGDEQVGGQGVFVQARDGTFALLVEQEGTQLLVLLLGQTDSPVLASRDDQTVLLPVQTQQTLRSVPHVGQPGLVLLGVVLVEERHSAIDGEGVVLSVLLSRDVHHPVGHVLLTVLLGGLQGQGVGH